MMRQATGRTGAVDFINPEGLYDPAPNGYSHVASVAAGARLVFVAGQGGDTADGTLAPDFRLQVRCAILASPSRQPARASPTLPSSPC
jgi:hypothetical protein